MFLDRATVLYGESGTGKSTFIIDILRELKPFADQIIVFCPTDRSHHTYSGKTSKDRIVPLPCIHYNITPQILENIWQRQQVLSNVYRRASDFKVLESLFRRVANDHSHVIQSIKKKCDERLAEIEESIIDPVTAGRKRDEIKFDRDRFIEIIYKHFINNNRRRLENMSLSKEEAYSLRFLNLNPRLVLIFDDCTELLDKLKNNMVIQKLSTQGRHEMITTLMITHTDKKIDSAFRKNVFVSIFTEDSCARAYINRASNDLDKKGKKIASDAVESTFVPSEPHQKLVWVREDRRWYRYTAKLHQNFTFGCPEVWSYCESVGADGDSIPSSNPFVEGFR